MTDIDDRVRGYAKLHSSRPKCEANLQSFENYCARSSRHMENEGSAVLGPPASIHRPLRTLIKLYYYSFYRRVKEEAKLNKKNVKG